MDTPSFKEDHISQIPALQFLIRLGYKYLSPEVALRMRNDKTTNVLLEDIIRKQLREINSVKISSTKSSYFSDANIEAGIFALKEVPMQEGYMAACEYIYDLLTYGKALEQSIGGDKKSFTLQYIDWENPENNVYHVTEEFPGDAALPDRRDRRVRAVLSDQADPDHRAVSGRRCGRHPDSALRRELRRQSRPADRGRQSRRRRRQYRHRGGGALAGRWLYAGDRRPQRHQQQVSLQDRPL